MLAPWKKTWNSGMSKNVQPYNTSKKGASKTPEMHSTTSSKAGVNACSGCFTSRDLRVSWVI